MQFSELFKAATQGNLPYPYQVQMADSPQFPELLGVPTGAGKTAAAVLGWLYRRRFHSSPDVRASTPRRLVYCLPMRTLVEQTHRAVQSWLSALGLQSPTANAVSPDGASVSVHLLMGGVETADWTMRPDQDAVLIGTQDMLLSRALNRGYAASRYQWPIEFALLNNDCFWVFDEPQLMGNGVATAAQLEGLRRSCGTIGCTGSLWMSATLEPAWLDTVDFISTEPRTQLTLGKHPGGDDLDPDLPLHTRMQAVKHVLELKADAKDPKNLARQVLGLHMPQTQTLLILNTVERAKAVFAELQAQQKKAKSTATGLLLAHSRFRPVERGLINAQLQDSQSGLDRIIVATQVIEAGVDLSARTLITELAPWASLVQRFGRCNRTGNDGPGKIYWLDLGDKQAPPYSAEELGVARNLLKELPEGNASPTALDEFRQQQHLKLPSPHVHVLRRRDLLDLFDTTPDLSGNEIDVRRFVRNDDPELDVRVFWRQFSDPENEPGPIREELCSVPIDSVQKFVKSRREKKTQQPVALCWDHLDEVWREVRDPEREMRPGQTLLLSAACGGYSELGWDPDSAVAVQPVQRQLSRSEEGAGSDILSTGSTPLTIFEHTQHVYDELNADLAELPQLSEWAGWLRASAVWHDAGKAHPAFQQGMRTSSLQLSADTLWAKSGGSGVLRHGRRYFRHELASALLALQHHQPFAVAYLIAAHHGRVRLSIRALPNEEQPQQSGCLFALGIHDGDDVPEIKLPGVTVPASTLDLAPMRLGGECSWTAHALELLQSLGPFRLGYLEAILRIADRRASATESGSVVARPR